MLISEERMQRKDERTVRVPEKIIRNHIIIYLSKITHNACKYVCIIYSLYEIFLSGLTMLLPRAKDQLIQPTTPGIRNPILRVGQGCPRDS